MGVAGDGVSRWSWDLKFQNFVFWPKIQNISSHSDQFEKSLEIWISLAYTSSAYTSSADTCHWGNEKSDKPAKNTYVILYILRHTLLHWNMVTILLHRIYNKSTWCVLWSTSNLLKCSGLGGKGRSYIAILLNKLKIQII